MDSPTHVALWVNLCGQFTNTSLLHLFHIIDIDMASLKKTLRTRSLSLTSSLFIKLTIEWRIITLRFIILCDINILEKTEVIWKKLTLRSFKLCSFVIFCEKTPKLFETSYPYVTSNYAHLRYFVKKKETNWNKLFIHNFNLILIWDILWKIKEVTWNKLPIRHWEVMDSGRQWHQPVTPYESSHLKQCFTASGGHRELRSLVARASHRW